MLVFWAGQELAGAEMGGYGMKDGFISCYEELLPA